MISTLHEAPYVIHTITLWGKRYQDPEVLLISTILCHLQRWCHITDFINAFPAKKQVQFCNTQVSGEKSFQFDDSVFPNVHRHIHLSEHPDCHNSELPAAWKLWWDGWKSFNKIWLEEKPLFLLVKCTATLHSPPNSPHLHYNNVSRRVCTWLRFLWNLEKQIHRKCKETPLSLSVGFAVRLRHPIRMWQYSDRLAPTPVSKWCITLTGPRCSADKEWHLPSRPQAKLIFKWHPGVVQGHYFRARVEVRKTQV